MNQINLEQFLQESLLELHTLEDWCARGWLLPQGAGGVHDLNQADAARAVFIRTLVVELGVNEPGIDVVLHLIDQLHDMRRVMHALQMGQLPGASLHTQD